MTLPPYIPGLVATTLAIGAALTPTEADSMSDSGFLRWILVTVCAGGGVVLWRFADVMWHMGGPLGLYGSSAVAGFAGDWYVVATINSPSGVGTLNSNSITIS